MSSQQPDLALVVTTAQGTNGDFTGGSESLVQDPGSDHGQGEGDSDFEADPHEEDDETTLMEEEAAAAKEGEGSTGGAAAEIAQLDAEKELRIGLRTA